MKRILIVCLLGMGLLLPYNKTTAKEFITKRIVDVYMEGDVLGVTSDSETGTLTKVDIYDSHQVKVLGQSCSGYSCYVNVSSLPNGQYTAKVITSISTFYEPFTLD